MFVNNGSSITDKLGSTPALVSVIIPTFNRPQFLPAAIGSVFNQTFTDWELLIADDGSDEETRAYLRTLERPPRVKIIWLAHTGNPGAVRNAALREATGEYVALLDSDDVWMPMKLELQIAALRSCMDRRWSYTGYVRIDETGGNQTYPGTRPWIPHRGAILERLLMHEVEIWTPAVVVERRLLVQVGGFDEKQPVFEDYDLWLRLACHSEIDLVDQPLIGVRSHDQHYCGGGIRMLASRLRSLDKMHCLLTGTHLRSFVDRLRAQCTLDLASLQANTRRLVAAGTLLRGCTHSWQITDWWAGFFWVWLKLATPRGLQALYRRGRFRRRSVST
jgi:glycosyltransferase involved in cell wall biosynthesis